MHPSSMPPPPLVHHRLVQAGKLLKCAAAAGGRGRASLLDCMVLSYVFAQVRISIVNFIKFHFISFCFNSI